ncbi:MAG: hypothetical protein ACK55H_12665 [Cyanobacteriota bacterium]
MLDRAFIVTSANDEFSRAYGFEIGVATLYPADGSLKLEIP